MAITQYQFTADGGTRIYPIVVDIINEDYLRIKIDAVPFLDTTLFDVINNSVVFKTAPSNGSTIVVAVADSLEDIANFDIIEGDITNSSVATVDSLTTSLSLLYEAVVVKEEGRGGVFVYDQTLSAVNNGGTVFNGWVRQYDGAVNVKWFGAVGDGVTDDTLSLQNAHNQDSNIYYPSGDYKVTSEILITTTGQRITGSGWGFAQEGSVTRIFSTLDIKLFKVTSNFCHFEHIFLDNVASSMSVPHIHFAGDVFSSIDRCRIQAVENFTAVGGGILMDNGAGGLGGSVGVINNINISHGTITIKRSDVHIKNSWIWANSRPSGITFGSGCGNIVIEGCDLLPPQTLVAGRKAAVYISGSATAPRLLGCNFDGNSSLSTGSGLLAENGVINLLVSGCYGFGHNEDCIILDSVIAPNINGNTFTNNNLSANGSTDIKIRQTFGQPIEKLLIKNNSFTQTTVLSGTTGPAIKLSAGVKRAGVKIEDNSIFQQGTGGGYNDIEIALDDGAFTSAIQGSLKGNRGTRTHYQVSGSISISADDAFETINFPITLAYAPRPEQINLSFASLAAGVNDYRFNSAGLPTVSAMGLGFPTVHPAFTLYYNIEL